jgi:repressor LexA
VNLTRRQREILDYVREFIEQRRYAPSIAEIGRQFGLRSTATVHKHLRNLEERGAIRRDWNRSRSIEVLPDESEERLVSLEVTGVVEAGKPIMPPESDECLNTPVTLVRGGRAHALRVRGDGLRDEDLRNGDFLVLIEKADPPDGATVVALLDGCGACVRTLHSDGARVNLRSAAEHVEPLVLRRGDLKILGLVAGLVRKY